MLIYVDKMLDFVNCYFMVIVMCQSVSLHYGSLHINVKKGNVILLFTFKAVKKILSYG